MTPKVEFSKLACGIKIPHVAKFILKTVQSGKYDIHEKYR